MKGWKEHFTNGTKGMPKVESGVLNYTEGLLKKIYDGNMEKVDGNPVAPWLVTTIAELGGPASISTTNLNNLKSVIEFVKKTGNANNFSVRRNPDGTFTKMSIDDAGAFANERLEKIKQKEQEKLQGGNEKKEETPVEVPKFDAVKETPKEDIPLLEDEKSGKIQRVWTSGDGSGRIWVKVIDQTWLSNYCDNNRQWAIGGSCQIETFSPQAGYQNFQFIGPPKGNKKGTYVTIVAMAVRKENKAIGEVKQEGNNMPGAQATSGGWSDADEQVVNFICYAPIMKEYVNKVGNYYGEERGDDLYNGGIGFLRTLFKKNPELFNKVADMRPDIIENSKNSLKGLITKEWIDARNINIVELAQKNPIDFIINFEKYYKRFGAEAKELLNKIDLEAIAKIQPNIILNNLGSFVGMIPAKVFFDLTKNIDFSRYIKENTDAFKILIKNMANEKEYSTMFKNLIFDHSLDIIDAFGGRGNGIYKFLQFAQSPRLRKHQDAIRDNLTGDYIAKREVVLNPEAGRENRIVKNEEFVVPDELKILNQKERRDFIIKNEDYIKSLIKTDEKGKEIAYLRFLFSESNQQDLERTLSKEKDEFINYYNQKFLKGDKKKVQLPNGEIVESGYMPGIFEFYVALNKKKPNFGSAFDIDITRKKHGEEEIKNSNSAIYYYPIKPEEAKKYIKEIIAYYYGIRKKLNSNSDNINSKNSSEINANLKKQYELSAKQTEQKNKYLAVRDYLKILSLSGESDEQIVEYYINAFKPEKLGMDPNGTIFLFLDNIKYVVGVKKAAKYIKSLKPYLDSIGNSGQTAYASAMDSLLVYKYLVNPGDMIEYTGFEEESTPNNEIEKIKGYGLIYLRYGKKYKVIDVREKDKIVNGEVLIQDEGDMNNLVQPQEKWLPSNIFKIKLTKEQPDQVDELNEFKNTLRNKLLNLLMETKQISYTGIVLDNKSKEKIKQFLKDMKKTGKIIIPDNWTFSADHITINTGKASDNSLLNQQVICKVVSYGQDQNVMALGVSLESDIDLYDKKPHITIAFNEKGGARPVMSQKIQKWIPVPRSFMLSGIIKEVEL